MGLLRDRLKPCPFCGGIADYKEDGYHGWVQCIECLAITDKYYAWRDKNWKEKATNDWNDRVPSTDQDKLQIEEAEHLKTIKERDNYHDVADQLANAIADHFGVDIGEHSNVNCPWGNALEWISPLEPVIVEGKWYCRRCGEYLGDKRYCANCGQKVDGR